MAEKVRENNAPTNVETVSTTQNRSANNDDKKSWQDENSGFVNFIRVIIFIAAMLSIIAIEKFFQITIPLKHHLIVTLLISLIWHSRAANSNKFLRFNQWLFKQIPFIVMLLLALLIYYRIQWELQ